MRSHSNQAVFTAVLALSSLASMGVTSCGDDDTSAATPTRVLATCPVCDDPVEIGALGDKVMNETSGVVASHAHKDVFWVHNDSGDIARVFAIDRSGALLATIDLEGASAVDHEDIAIGPCPEGTCLFSGDIGDNLTFRDDCSVFRYPEPTELKDGKVKVTEFRYSYPDGAHNAETLLVHPLTGALMVVTKEKTGPSQLFEIPTDKSGPIVAVKRGEVTPPMGDNLITGGDIDSTGGIVVLRTYSNVFAYPIPLSNLVADAFKTDPCVLPTPDEPQGEALGFDGQSLVTISEGTSAPIHRMQCSW